MNYEKDVSYERIKDILKDHTRLLHHKKSLDPLMDAIGDRKIVMLGEASHGTHEFYLWRAMISQRLIEEKGFRFIAVEGDWPDCYQLNRYIKGYQPELSSPEEVLRRFDRWPTWMWANWEVASLASWLHGFNQRLPANQRIGFYGLDVYSLWESLEAMIGYLDKEDRHAAEEVRELSRCFEPYRGEGGQAYAWAARQTVPAPCQEDVLNLLRTIRERVPHYDQDQEAVISTEQNAHVVHNAEKYYRAMIGFGPESWNVRDHHMTDTLDRLMDFHGQDAKAIIWEHNTHIGDARATDMAEDGLVNVGQLVRERYGRENTFALGFGSYEGSVIASNKWGAPMEKMQVPQARYHSWEDLMHQASPHNSLLLMEDVRHEDDLKVPLAHRAIGVVYHPEQESRGNYVPSDMTERYDAFIHIEKSEALHPLHLAADQAKTPESYPWGL
ncbi:MAG: erythromycin esterase family protein [Cyclobacteriaceae bacterium]